MAELFFYRCDECGGPTTHYDHVMDSSICGKCALEEIGGVSPKGKARIMIDDWKRKNEGGYKGLTDIDCPMIYGPYIPLDEDEPA